MNTEHKHSAVENAWFPNWSLHFVPDAATCREAGSAGPGYRCVSSRCRTSSSLRSHCSTHRMRHFQLPVFVVRIHPSARFTHMTQTNHTKTAQKRTKHNCPKIQEAVPLVLENTKTSLCFVSEKRKATKSLSLWRQHLLKFKSSWLLFQITYKPQFLLGEGSQSKKTH